MNLLKSEAQLKRSLLFTSLGSGIGAGLLVVLFYAFFHFMEMGLLQSLDLFLLGGIVVAIVAMVIIMQRKREAPADYGMPIQAAPPLWLFVLLAMTALVGFRFLQHGLEPSPKLYASLFFAVIVMLGLGGGLSVYLLNALKSSRIKLPASEPLLQQGFGAYFDVNRPINGRLYLTAQRLFFVPGKEEENQPIPIELNEVAELGVRKVLFQQDLIVRLQNGLRYEFCMPKATQWQSQIEAQMVGQKVPK